MSMVPGFNGNLRLNSGNGLAGAVPLEDKEVEINDGVEVDPNKAILKIVHEHGAVCR